MIRPATSGARRWVRAASSCRATAPRLTETLTRLDPPHSFGYTIDAVGGPITALVGSAEGRWAFEPVGTGTRVTWSWQVEPANAVASVLMPVFGRMWDGFARQGFEQIEALLVR